MPEPAKEPSRSVSATEVITPPVMPQSTADWGQYLSPAWRAHFEQVGEDSVQFDVSHHNYGCGEKQFAALAWLGEKRRNRERLNWWTFFVAVATLLVALVTLGVTVWPW
jgi:hypothetical protein